MSITARRPPGRLHGAEVRFEAAGPVALGAGGRAEEDAARQGRGGWCSHRMAAPLSTGVMRTPI